MILVVLNRANAATMIGMWFSISHSCQRSAHSQTLLIQGLLSVAMLPATPHHFLFIGDFALYPMVFVTSAGGPLSYCPIMNFYSSSLRDGPLKYEARHPTYRSACMCQKYVCRHPKYSDIRLDTQKISSEFQKIRADTQGPSVCRSSDTQQILPDLFTKSNVTEMSWSQILQRSQTLRCNSASLR